MRHALERLYRRAPVWAQNALCTLEGARIHHDRYPHDFDWWLRQARERESWPRAGLELHRLERLRTMLVHAGRDVPYWRDLFADVRFDPKKLAHTDELAALPPLTKDIVIAQGSRMLAEHVPSFCEAGRPVRLATSGTTGAGLQLVASASAVEQQWVICWRYLGWHGIPRDAWCARLGGRLVVPVEQREPPFWRTNLAGRQLLFSAYHLGPDTVLRYLHEIARRRIPWIHGYPSLVVQLADAAAATGTRLPALRWVTLGSESVTAAQHARIVEGLGVIPRQHYAQTEAVANASEGRDGAIRFDDDYSVVELVHESDIAGCGVHRILGTSLDNWHQPFIRYDTGDLATAVDASAPWRAPGRRVDDIDGRREDYVILRSGARVGRTDHIFKSLTYVREAQIRQTMPGAVVIHVVPRDGVLTPDQEARLRREASARLGDTDIAVVTETRLPRNERGKLRLVVRTQATEPAPRVGAQEERRAG